MSKSIYILVLTALLAGGVSAQLPPLNPGPTESNSDVEVRRENRQLAYTRLLKAQRFIWGMSRIRSVAELQTGIREAKQALLEATVLDPTLSEAHTALAELGYYLRPQDISESIARSEKAISINPDNFGAHYLLAKIYTEKSRISRGALDKNSAARAVDAWEEVVRLDPSNAEAYAFLSAFYERSGDREARKSALRKWIGATAPLDTRFYRSIFGSRSSLSPEVAMIRLGAVLVAENKGDEAVAVLGRAISEKPDDQEAIRLMGEALDVAGAESVQGSIEALQQALFSNPENHYLIALLARVQARTGDIDSAARILLQSIVKFNETDKAAAATLQILLGDLYQDVSRHDEAAANYKTALAIRGLEAVNIVSEKDRSFAMMVYEKLIRTYTAANRLNDVRDIISRARVQLNDSKLFADKM